MIKKKKKKYLLINKTIQSGYPHFFKVFTNAHTYLYAEALANSDRSQGFFHQMQN